MRFWSLVGGLSLLGLALLWCAWTVWATAQDLREVEEEAQILRAALVRGDVDGARETLGRYREAADSAAGRTSGPTWAVFEHVPVLGDDAEAIAIVSGVLSDVGRDGLEPVANAAQSVTSDAFRPAQHRFPIDRIAALEEPAEVSQAAFGDAAATLAGVDSSRLIGPVQTAFDQLRGLVDDARATLDSTYRASRLIPRMLGEERPRYYLLVLQNNAEMRSGGGLAGALSLVRMQSGSIDIVGQEDMADVGLGSDSLPLTKEEERVFGANLTRAGGNATLTPDVARSADLIRARWEQAMGGRLDGVVYVDPVAVSYLLRGVGSVPVPGGGPVDATNVVSAVENQIYRLTGDRSLQSDYQQAVAKAVFDAFADGRGDTVAAIQGLVQAVGEGRIRMHSFDAEDQAEIAGTDIAGDFLREAESKPHVGIYVNDSGPTKMQYYLQYEATVTARSCTDDDRQVIAGSIELHSNTPTDLSMLTPAITGENFPGVRVAPGHQLLTIYLTSPVGGEIQELRVDGQRVSTPVVEPFANRSLSRIGVELAPQSSHEIEFLMASGEDQPGEIDLRVTPGAFPSSSNTSAPSACVVY
ncbi:DUF4012 domain-containing protein [Nocardioides caeni]|uniref:DUF4012 domain-containing protein n=1 Tax=Nocardioides caeni TaxID=574700 RepID=UPI0013052756|nr:DUF4012 domain-containing protein [Nocardioides caeni]